MYTKKGIMLKFLTTLILALIIFIPACMFVSNFFRLSDQAKSNFYSFADEIKTFAEKGQDGEAKSTVLILDKGTFIMNIWAKDNEYNYKRCTSEGTEEHVTGPGDLCSKQDCICLIREFDVLETSSVGNYCKENRDIVTITPKKFDCVEITSNNYVYGLDWRNWNRFIESDARRIEMGMIKKGNVVFVCRNKPCLIPDQPQNHPTKKSGFSTSIVNASESVDLPNSVDLPK